ncbi:hypothetical protein C5609_13185 [Pseudomonas putida]|nr:hypothetical protein C5609_13185 [Pseudomonas putida]
MGTVCPVTDFLPAPASFCGHARSHRLLAGHEACGVPSGAGIPAKGPAPATQSPPCQSRHLAPHYPP